jgi:hypothetical protein
MRPIGGRSGRVLRGQRGASTASMIVTEWRMRVDSWRYRMDCSKLSARRGGSLRGRMPLAVHGLAGPSVAGRASRVSDTSVSRRTTAYPHGCAVVYLDGRPGGPTGALGVRSADLRAGRTGSAVAGSAFDHGVGDRRRLSCRGRKMAIRSRAGSVRLSQLHHACGAQSRTYYARRARIGCSRSKRPPGTCLRVWLSGRPPSGEGHHRQAAGASDVEVVLNARGFRVRPHKNKHGRDYPTNAGRERY